MTLHKKPGDETEALRERAEKMASAAKEFKTLSPQETSALLHDLQVHQIELEIQNEELRRAQSELDTLRARYFDLYDLAPVGYVTLSEKGMILESNLTAATLLDVTRSDLVHQPLSRFILKEDQDIYYMHRRALFDTGEPQVCILRLIKKEGTIFWARIEATLAFEDDGAPVCRVIVCDITMTKFQEDERELSAYLTLSVNTPGDFRACMSDLTATLKNWSGCEAVGIRLRFGEDYPYYETRGFSSEFVQSESTLCTYDSNGRVVRDILGNPILDCMCGNILCGRFDPSKPFFTPYGSFWTNSTSALLQGTTDADRQSRTRNRCNGEGYESVALVPLKTDDQVWGLLQFNDRNRNRFTPGMIAHLEWLAGRLAETLSRRKAKAILEEENIKLEAKLRQSQKMETVGRLAGGVAHDFNNMLGVIIGHAEMALEQMKPDQSIHEDLMEIRKAAIRSADLTRQLLTFARKQAITPKVIDLNETVEGVKKMLGRLIGESIQLFFRPGPDLWNVMVDPTQIDQILLNLCVNAMDAISDVGEITIETENRTIDAAYCLAYDGVTAGGYVRIAVIDNGSGMDEETLNQVFEPFFTTKALGKGTGLGLSTVYGAVKQNDGFIHVTSNPGRGTMFEIFLPWHKCNTEPARKAVSVEFPLGGNETILLVEDEPAILKLTKTMLESLGHTVLAVNTPRDAISLARDCADKIHLLITDVIMPEINGWDLAKNLTSFKPELKHLFMSGYTADVIAHHGVLGPEVHFIEKPFSKKELSLKVRETLDI